MSIKKVAYSLSKSLPHLTIARTHAYELIAAAFSFKSYAATADYLFIDSTTSQDINIEMVNIRAEQLRLDCTSELIDALKKLLDTTRLKVLPLMEIIKELEVYPTENPDLIETALMRLAENGSHWAHYGIALLYMDTVRNDPPSDYWFKKRMAGEELSEQANKFAEEYQYYKDAKQKCEFHLRLAGNHGNCHALWRLHEIFGDNDIFQECCCPKKMNRELSWVPVDIARSAVECGFQDAANQWYAVGCSYGDIEAIREMAELCAATNPRLAWTLVEFGRLLGTDITLSEAIAIDEEGNLYDDDLGGGMYIDETEGLEMADISTADHIYAKSMATTWFTELTQEGIAKIDTIKMG